MQATLVATIAARLLARREWLGCAESCTGGMLAKLLTDVAGSSQWFERALVTYSNRAKSELLGVDDRLLQAHGAVSGECAEAMALGLLRRAPLQWALAVTGIAGPSGGSADKPVGTVWIACAHDGRADTRHFVFAGDRDRIRQQAAAAALAMLANALPR